MSLAPERSSEHPAFLPASCTDSQTQQHPCGQELGCSVHFCLRASRARLPDSLERSLQSHFHTSSASGHGRYEPLPMCAASTGEQGKARTRTSSPQNSSGESPVRAASMGSGSCRLCTLVASPTTVPAVQCVSEEPWLALGLQRQLLSRGCTAAQHKVIHSQSEGHALPCTLAASQQARPNHNRTRIAEPTRLPATVARPAGQGSCKVKRSDFGPTGVLYSLIFSPK